MTKNKKQHNITFLSSRVQNKLMFLTVKFKDRQYTIEVEEGSEAELFQWQVYSLTDISPEDQKWENCFDIEIDPECVLPLESLGWKDGSTIVLVAEDTEAEEKGADVHDIRAPSLEELASSCTKCFLGGMETRQPCFTANGGEFNKHCRACAEMCKSGSEAPEPTLMTVSSESFVCACSASSTSTCLFSERGTSSMLPPGSKAWNQTVDMLKNAADEIEKEELRLKMQKEEEEKLREEKVVNGGVEIRNEAEGLREIQQRVLGNLEVAKLWDSKDIQRQARGVVPIEELQERAKKSIADAGSACTLNESDAFLKELLAWFKTSFMQWVNQPPCDFCGGATHGIGGARPSAEDSFWMAARVELYQCNDNNCGKMTRFPRYNHPGKLLITRKGRCGEWANTFTMICRAFGYHAREVIDWTDHVWTEVFLEGPEQRFIHLDPCENAWDAPLTYEAGWGKQLSYCFAVSAEELADVTRRYTNNWDAVLSRRTLVREESLMNQLQRFNSVLISQQPPARQALLMARQERDRKALFDDASTSTGGSSTADVLPRQSGAKEWRAMRGELGTGSRGSASTSTSTCESCASEEVDANASCTVPLPASSTAARPVFRRTVTIPCLDKSLIMSFDESKALLGHGVEVTSWDMVSIAHVIDLIKMKMEEGEGEGVGDEYEPRSRTRKCKLVQVAISLLSTSTSAMVSVSPEVVQFILAEITDSIKHSEWAILYRYVWLLSTTLHHIHMCTHLHNMDSSRSSLTAVKLDFVNKLMRMGIEEEDLSMLHALMVFAANWVVVCKVEDVEDAHVSVSVSDVASSIFCVVERLLDILDSFDGTKAQEMVNAMAMVIRPLGSLPLALSTIATLCSCSHEDILNTTLKEMKERVLKRVTELQLANVDGDGDGYPHIKRNFVKVCMKILGPEVVELESK